MKIQCDCLRADVVAQYLQGSSSETEAQQLEAHAHECNSCFTTLASAAATNPFFKAALSAPPTAQDTTIPAEPLDSLKARLKALGAAAALAPNDSMPDGTADFDNGAGSDRARDYDFLAPPREDSAAEELGWLGGYRIVTELGRGGMGVVFGAEDPRLGRQVAVKVMLPRLAADPNARLRFVREARSAATVEHPNIVPIYHVGEDRDVPYFVMPLLRGESLAQRLRRSPPLAIREVLTIGRQMALALAAAHGRGLVHRDIKPSNLFLVSTTVKMLDFGLAHSEEPSAATGEPLTRPGTVVGTPEYMSPQQARGEKSDFRTDLYSAGVVLYQLAAGKLPFAATTASGWMVAHATETPGDVRTLNPDVPPLLATTIMQLLAKDPACRPASAQVLVERFDRLMHGNHAAPSRGRPDIVMYDSHRRRWLLGVAGALTAMALIAGVVWFIRDWGDGGPFVERPGAAPAPVRVKALRVLHYARVEGGVVERGLVGEKSFEAAFEDPVKVTLELSAPAYTYLLAFNTDGAEQLLWPVGADLKPSATVAPPHQDRVEYPVRQGKRFFLDDDPDGGVQVFVAVVASEPLPAYATWKDARGPAAWRKLPAVPGVWSSDGDAVYPVRAGQVVRGTERDLPGVPPLRELCRSLQQGATVVAVEALAFPVRAKE